MDYESKFQSEYSLEKRMEVSEKRRSKHPDRIPVIVEKNTKSKLLDSKKRSFLVPQNISIEKLSVEVRKHIPLAPVIFLFVKDREYNVSILPPTSTIMEELDKKYRDEDGFLYISYSGENTFGGEVGPEVLLLLLGLPIILAASPILLVASPFLFAYKMISDHTDSVKALKKSAEVYFKERRAFWFIDKEVLEHSTTIWVEDFFFCGLHVDDKAVNDWEKRNRAHLEQIVMTSFRSSACDYVLESVTLVGNPFLLHNFISKLEDGSFALAYHGTRESNFKSIVKKGFIYRGQLDPGYFGKGYYFTTNPEYAMHYITDIDSIKDESSGMKKLKLGATATLICAYLNIGKTRIVQDMNFFGQEVHDYHSHIIQVSHKLHGGRLDFFPTEEGEVPAADEIVMFHSDRILPRFLVTVKRVKKVLWLSKSPPVATSGADKVLFENIKNTGHIVLHHCTSIDEALNLSFSIVVVSGSLGKEYIPRLFQKQTENFFGEDNFDFEYDDNHDSGLVVEDVSGSAQVKDSTQADSSWILSKALLFPKYILVYCWQTDLHEQWAQEYNIPVTRDPNEVFSFIIGKK